ncbi:DNAJC2 [Lepeophtheirus salmonis]|uniref:DNAJC2 n=1 Tax=Lepeophtheirus salmonis TaxID=72036 RepID=A0A7R8CM15_LEPSM|nr:DNAJC2 [Lepeophtheirus salmonis]CAF2862468.1 DNAJC2 [Lepeophtheirus salmonis]
MREKERVEQERIEAEAKAKADAAKKKNETLKKALKKREKTLRTNQRWEVIASYINQHTQTPEIERKAKETLVKAKELQQGNFHMSTLKEEVNKKAYENLEKQKKQRDVKVDDYEASTRMDSAAEVQGINVNPWSQEEQALFEQALKTHPSSLGSVRWERISETLPSRSKKDCMRRYKKN